MDAIFVNHIAHRVISEEDTDQECLFCDLPNYPKRCQCGGYIHVDIGRTAFAHGYFKPVKICDRCLQVSPLTREDFARLRDLGENPSELSPALAGFFLDEVEDIEPLSKEDIRRSLTIDSDRSPIID